MRPEKIVNIILKVLILVKHILLKKGPFSNEIRKFHEAWK